jgi:signal transduction histidine kinase
VIIGFIDYISGPELSFAIFYLIPLALLALYRGTTVILIIISSVFASILWFVAEYTSRDYSHIFFPVWNAFVRLSIFLIVGFLLFSYKEKLKKLKAFNIEKNKFIGMASHDLRSPLSGIHAFSNLLLTEYHARLNPEASEIIHLIKTMSSNCLELIKDLLDISKIESGNIELHYEKQDYIAFIKEQIRINQLLAKNKNITLSLQSQKDSIQAEFDNHYFTEVIGNLLSNAIKYSHKNSDIIIKISIENQHQILTEVIDKGQGIPENEQQKLFNYFQRTSTQPTDGEQSTGLGLAITKKIITHHNGQIGVKSILNQGSNFYFSFPVTHKSKIAVA